VIPRNQRGKRQRVCTMIANCDARRQKNDEPLGVRARDTSVVTV
jgi:hypothetical protein